MLRKFQEDFRKTTIVFEQESLENIFSILDSKDQKKIAEINQAKAVSGHYPYGLHKLLEGESRYFTLLRDPVNRARSYYSYSLKNEGSKIYQYLKDNNVSFEQFAEMEKKDIEKSGVHELNYILEDGQSKMIAGEDLLIGDGNTAHLLDIAEENIAKHFDFVGVTELFDDAFIEINKMLGFSPFSLYITQNKSPVKVTISDNAHKTLLERNPIDASLHEKYYNELKKTSESIPHQLTRAFVTMGKKAADQYVKLRS
ncbi:hypothetical protein [Alteromonas sp. a30]|uniref:hypothetical protein n=1 Tax=Alteromonas sp. a30 TaxID=2730917 RepID=UPI002DDD4851|nr:hypothetical protein [Alteromonas sp. a30]